MAIFAKNEDEKRSPEKSEMYQFQNVSNKSVLGHKAKEEDDLPPQKMYPMRFQSPRRKYTTMKRKIRKRTVLLCL